MPDTLETLCRALQDRGVEPSQFREYAPAAAEKVAPGNLARQKEILRALSDLAAVAHAAGVSSWEVFRFGVTPLADAFPPGSRQDFRTLVADLSQFVSAVAEGKLTDSTAVQRLPPSLHASKGKPWMTRTALQVARHLAKDGTDPSEFLRLAYPALVEAAGEASEAEFAPVSKAIQDSFGALDERGVSPTWPIAQGVIALASAFKGDLVELSLAVRELAELCILMHSHGHVPHPAIEYGLAPAFNAATMERWFRPEIFPVAFAIAHTGAHPGLALERLSNMLAFGPTRGPEALAKLRDLAERRQDVARLIAAIPSAAGAAAGDESRLETLFARLITLVTELEAQKLRVSMALEDGVPAALSTPVSAPLAERILEYATRLARARIDPGPGLLHGLSPAFSRIADAFREADSVKLVESVMASAEDLLAEGIDPWRFLEPGIFAALRIAGKNVETFLAVVGEIHDLVLGLHRAGVQPEPILLYGVHNLAMSVSGQNDARTVFSASLKGMLSFAPRLTALGIDASRAANSGLSAVAQLASEARATWLIDGATHLAIQLAEAGLDPTDMLQSGLPALTKSISTDAAVLEPIFAELVRTAPRKGVAALDSIVVEAVRDVPSPRDALVAALQFVRESKTDATALARELIPALARKDALREGTRAATAFLDRHGNVSEPLADAAAAAAQVAAKDGAKLGRLLDLCAKTEAALGSSLGLAARTANVLAGDREDVFVRVMSQLAERARAYDGDDARLAFQFAAWTLAPRAKGKEADFLRAFDALKQLLHGKFEDELQPQDLREHVLPIIASGGSGADVLARGLEDAVQLRTAKRLSYEVLRPLALLASIGHDVPMLWTDLLVPTLRAQTGARPILYAFERMRRWIVDDDSLALLRHIVTQEGVRAVVVLWDLLVAGLELGVIRSLSEEKDLLLGFLGAVSIPHTSFYEKYRAIVTDASRTDADRKEAVAAMERSVEDLAKAVVAGAVPSEKEADPLLGHVFFHVFPPAISASQEQYLELFKARADHRDQTDRYAKTGGQTVSLPRGGYRIRNGEVIDTQPFEALREAVKAVHGSPGEEPIEALGRDLLAAWLDGSAASSKTRPLLLARIYRRWRLAGHSLAETLGDAEDFLRYREFLADAAREIVQDALRQVRIQAPERYEELVRARLSPKPHVGPGLVRAVWGTLEGVRAKKVESADAKERLSRQLRGFDWDYEKLLAIPDRTALQGALESAPAKEGEVALGGEHIKVVQDLAGQDAAAMQRELFGDGKARGKLEYRDAVDQGLSVRLEVTKRRAHVDLGFCEGVCTAVDGELWDDARFAHVAIWADDGRALGGMHLLAVEREGASPALALPGINPSLELIGESGERAVLDALLDFAKRLASENGFSAVWIPHHQGIMSNRGPIQAAIVEKKFESRPIPNTRFSYRPYAYSFDRVLIVFESA